MAKPKCLVCGKELDKANAYRVELIVNKKTGEKELKYRYCCSEEEWQTEDERKKKAKEDKNKVYELICDMFGYEIQNTRFFDEWSKWNKLKSNEIIYKYLRENETHLQQVCDKIYNNENGRIRYFSAILKNSLRDYVPKVEVVEKPKVATIAFELFEPIVETQPKFEEQVLYDVEDDLI